MMPDYCTTLGELWGWKNGDGAVVGWYDRMPPGSRWFAGVRWIVGGGEVLTPLSLEGAVDTMEWKRLYLEARDVVEGQKPWGDYLAPRLLAVQIDVDPGSARREIEQYVIEARRLYGEALAPWSVNNLLGSTLMGYPQRRGWEIAPDDMNRLRRARAPMQEYPDWTDADYARAALGMGFGRRRR